MRDLVYISPECIEWHEVGHNRNIEASICKTKVLYETGRTHSYRVATHKI